MTQLNRPSLRLRRVFLRRNRAIAVSLLLGLLVALPVSAEQPEALMLAQALNQSDVTGTSPGDIPAPIIDDVIDQNSPPDETRDNPGTRPESTAAIVEQSRQLSAELRDAYADCVASRVAVTNVPRRFARGDASNDTCVSVECTQLNELMQEARQFLNSLSTTQRSQIQQSHTLRLW